MIMLIGGAAGVAFATVLYLRTRRHGLNVLRFNALVFLASSYVPYLAIGDKVNLDAGLVDYHLPRLFFCVMLLAALLADRSELRGRDEPGRDSEVQMLRVIGLGSALVIVAYHAFVGLRDLPIFNIGAHYTELIALRESAFKLADVPAPLAYAAFIVKYCLIPMFAAGVAVYGRRLGRWWLVALLPIMLFNQVATLSKTALVITVMAVMLGAMLTSSVSLLKVAIGAAAVASVPVAILFAITSDRELTQTVLAVGSRLFLVPEASVQDYYELARMGEFKGLASSKVTAMIGGGQFVNVQEFVYWKLVGRIGLEHGTAPGNMFAMSYVDFGTYGAFVYLGAIAVMVYVGNRIIVSVRGRLQPVLATSTMIALAFMYFTSAFTALGSYGALLVLLLAWLWRRPLRLA